MVLSVGKNQPERKASPVRRRIVFLLDEINRARDPRKFSLDQLPRLKELFREYKRQNER
jgi:hypothetical protein